MHTPQLKYNTALLLASDRCEGLTVPAACFQFILCWQGEMSLRLNGLSLSVKPGHLLACPPESVVESLTQSPNFRCYYLRIAAAYLQQLLPMADKDWELKPLLDEHPLFTLESDVLPVPSGGDERPGHRFLLLREERHQAADEACAALILCQGISLQRLRRTIVFPASQAPPAQILCRTALCDTPLFVARLQGVQRTDGLATH